MKKYFTLFSNCIPTMGYKQAVITDLQNGVAKIYPKKIIQILKERKDVLSIKQKYQTDSGLDAFFQDLIENNMGFYCDDLTLFPELNLQWKTPNKITNAVILLDKLDVNFFNKVLKELNNVNCFTIQIRFSSLNVNEIKNILHLIDNSHLRTIELIFLYEIDLVKLHEEINTSRKIFNVEVYCFNKEKSNSKIRYYSKSYNERKREFTVVDGFVINMKHFTEAQEHNTLLNRKVIIESDGEVKNIIYQNKIYGNIKNVSLGEIIDKDDYRNCWFTKRDSIDVCRDCEFKYICTEYRSSSEQISNIDYSKFGKCDYNPYIAKWKNQNSWISVQEWRETYQNNKLPH